MGTLLRDIRHAVRALWLAAGIRSELAGLTSTDFWLLAAIVEINHPAHLSLRLRLQGPRDGDVG